MVRMELVVHQDLVETRETQEDKDPLVHQEPQDQL